MCSVIIRKLTSPLVSISVGYSYVTILVIIFWRLGIHKSSSFFSFGIPIFFMGKEINDYPTYFALLSGFFIHQVINNWINNVVYPWIINYVQDNKSQNLYYSKAVSLLIINLFAMYSELDVMFIVMGLLTQFVFFLVLILANVVTSSIINWQYIKEKDRRFIHVDDDYNSRYT